MFKNILEKIKRRKQKRAQKLALMEYELNRKIAEETYHDIQQARMHGKVYVGMGTLMFLEKYGFKIF